jgi:hypothetical protein
MQVFYTISRVFALCGVSVPEITEEPHEAAAEELHEMVFGCALSNDFGAGRCQVCHQVVGIDVVSVEYGEFAARVFQHLLPYLFPILQLQHCRISGDRFGKSPSLWLCLLVTEYDYYKG